MAMDLNRTSLTHRSRAAQWPLHSPAFMNWVSKRIFIANAGSRSVLTRTSLDVYHTYKSVVLRTTCSYSTHSYTIVRFSCPIVSTPALPHLCRRLNNVRVIGSTRMFRSLNKTIQSGDTPYVHDGITSPSIDWTVRYLGALLWELRRRTWILKISNWRL